MKEYGAILLVFLTAALVAGGMIFLTSVLGPRKMNPAKKLPFECGKDPFALPAGHFAVKFYLVAMLFILFDIELVFLVPWAVLYKQLGLFGLIEMAVFMIFLLSGFVYAWKKGAMEWQ